MEKKDPTTEEMENYFSKLLEKFKQDPKFELRQELGKLLMIHINDFTAVQRKRYDELLKLLKEEND